MVRKPAITLDFAVPNQIGVRRCREISREEDPTVFFFQLKNDFCSHLLYAVLGEDSRGAPDGPQVETPVLFAGLGHLLAPAKKSVHKQEGRHPSRERPLRRQIAADSDVAQKKTCLMHRNRLSKSTFHPPKLASRSVGKNKRCANNEENATFLFWVPENL